MRWLVTDVPSPVELTIPQSSDPGGAVELQVRVRDPKFQPLDNAGVTLEIQSIMADTNGAAKPFRIQTEAAVNEPGLYQAVYVPRATGGYKATAFVTNSVGVEVGRAVAAEQFQPAVSTKVPRPHRSFRLHHHAQIHSRAVRSEHRRQVAPRLEIIASRDQRRLD